MQFTAAAAATTGVVIRLAVCDCSLSAVIGKELQLTSPAGHRPVIILIKLVYVSNK